MTDNGFLRSHGGNLAAVLHRLEAEENDRFRLICRHVGRILPGFRPLRSRRAVWQGLAPVVTRHSDMTFGAHLTSEGSLRFFALVTLLNLPPEMLPDVILLDEPELGLHPTANRPRGRDGEGGRPHQSGDRGHAITAVRRCVSGWTR